MKKCSKCKKEKPFFDFYKDKNTKSGYKYQCKKCHNETAHSARKFNKKDFLDGVYRHMKERVDGTHYKQKSSAEGKGMLDKDVFISWSLENFEFNLLFKNYINNKFKFKFAPSIDRIDVNYGYVLENMQWLSIEDNSRKGMLVDIYRLRIKLKE